MVNFGRISNSAIKFCSKFGPKRISNSSTDFAPHVRVRLDPKFWSKTSWIQLMYSFWICLTHVAIGMAFGFAAVQVPQLDRPDSPIQITLAEASWIASVLTLLSPIGCIISGFMMDKYGRRLTLISCEVPMCIGWFYTGFAPTCNHIIIGRVITGIGCGMAMAPPRIYCAEISLPNMRPVMGSFMNLGLAVGITVQAALGTVYAWQILCYICGCYTACLLLVYILLPETPYFVLVKSSVEDARKNLAKFRAADYNINPEIDQMVDFKRANDIRSLSFKEKIQALFQRSAWYPFTVLMIYFIFCQLAGTVIVMTWAVDILTLTHSSVDVYFGYFLMAFTRLIFGLLTAVLLFLVGRKTLALISASGVAVICFILASFLYYQTELSIAPQICLMIYMAFATIGYFTLPFLIMSEIYPLQVRGLLSGITVSLCNLLVFGATKWFPYVITWIGLPNTIIFFGVSSLLGVFFIYFYLPETKDLTLQEIEEYFNRRRANLTSQRRYENIIKRMNSKEITDHIELENLKQKNISDTGKTRKRPGKKEAADSYVATLEGPTPVSSLSSFGSEDSTDNTTQSKDNSNQTKNKQEPGIMIHDTSDTTLSKSNHEKSSKGKKS